MLIKEVRDMSDEQRYTIGELAAMAGTTARTLRHYEDVGLLAPARDTNGYRVYSASDAQRLAQVLSMRACGLPLPIIRRLFNDPKADVRAALVSHLQTLRAQGESLEEAVRRTEAAIAAIERIEGMEAKDAFEQMKAEDIARSEGEYGAEARERYGNAAVDDANERLMALTHDEWNAKELLEESIKVQLRIAMSTGDPASEESAELAHMHARWIRIHWGDSYTPEAHRGLAQVYLADERFIRYYDSACGEGATEFLADVIAANI